MFAVIKTGGKQYKAQEGDVLQIEKLDVKKGQEIIFDQVLLVEDKGKALIGTPYVEHATVKAVVIDNFKDEKIIVFKKKRRKQYKRKRGHRQELTRIQIEKILTGKEPAAKKKPVAKEEAKPAPKAKAAPVKAATKAPAKKPAAKPAAKPAKKAPAPKKKAAAAPKETKPKAKAPAKKKPAAKAKSPAKPAAKAKKADK